MSYYKDYERNLMNWQKRMLIAGIVIAVIYYLISLIFNISPQSPNDTTTTNNVTTTIPNN